MTNAMSTIRRIGKYRIVYLMMLPGFLFTAVLAYAPLYGLYMAVSNYKLGKPIIAAPFVGLKYFKEVLIDSSDMGYLLRNTIAMNLISLVVGLSVALLFAVLLSEVRVLWIKKIVQTVSFLPFFISWVIVYSMLQAFFSAEGGAFNIFMKQIGLFDHGIAFLAEPKYAWSLVVLSNLWKSLGYNAVIFLASIAGIDVELYDAANIDGADKLQKIRHITLPSLMPTLQTLLILNVGWIFTSNFDQYYLFTNALNRPMMEVFDMYIYRFGLKQLNYSYATAVGIVKSVAGIAIIAFVNYASKKTSGKAVL